MEAENKQTVRKEAQLIKIELNDQGDHIVISTGDSTLFDRFMEGFLQIADEAAGLPGEYRKIEKKHRSAKELPMYKNVDIARADVEFSKKAVKIINDLFGKDTLKKYFRQLYDEVPDFLPGAECFVDFFKNIAPVMDKWKDIVSWITDKINWLKDKMGSISSSFGSFGSKISGSFKNFSISSAGVQIPVSPVVAALSSVEIPAYATGQVIPRTMKQHLAILGDNSQETEVVSPLSTIEQAVENAINKVGGFGGMGEGVVLAVTLELDGDVLLTKMQKLNRQFFKQNGRGAFA